MKKLNGADWRKDRARKGGYARARKLSALQRSRSARKASRARWERYRAAQRPGA